MDQTAIDNLGRTITPLIGSIDALRSALGSLKTGDPQAVGGDPKAISDLTGLMSEFIKDFKKSADEEKSLLNEVVNAMKSGKASRSKTKASSGGTGPDSKSAKNSEEIADNQERANNAQTSGYKTGQLMRNLSNELKIRIRVNRPYAKFYNASDSTETAVNGNRPLYSFNTGDLYAKRNQGETAKDALDLINVVPNPYYAYSGYEKNQLDNRVKITNLPQECKIRIYTTSGILVRTYSKADPSTSLDWDLKNQAGISISSGIYIIHVDVPGVGEKVVKFFGVMRPIDLDTF
jgi:hypothetical protein